MFKSGKFVASFGIGIVCLLLVAATFAFTLTPAQPAAQAAPVAQVTPTAAPAKPDPTKADPTKPPSDQGKAASPDDTYQTLFNKTFAAKLGVSEDVMKTAFAAALAETTAQMVKDGILDSNQAAKLQGLGAQGPGTLLPSVMPDNAARKGKDVTDNQATNPKLLLINSLPAIAPMLKLSADDLSSRLQDGQSLNELAVAANVDLQTLKTAILASIKSQLDDAVKAGKLTQADADEANKTAGSFVDNFVNASPNPVDKAIKKLFDSDTTWQAAAKFLNLPVNTLQDRVKQGQSILQIAQDQKLDEAKLREAIQASLQSQLDALVRGGQVTADQSAEITSALPKITDGFITQTQTKTK